MNEASVQNSQWPGPLFAITLFVEDLEATKAFYQSVFGLPIVFEDDNSAIFTFGATMLNFLKTTAASELIEPAIAANPETGARFVFTLKADDVDAKCAELIGKGVELLNGPMDRPWGPRTVSFRDPSGYIWEIAN